MSSRTATKYSDKQIASRVNAELKYVKLGLMRMSPQSQRELNQAWSNKIASEMDLEKLGTPVLSQRDGYYFIIDGGHRTDALKKYLGPGWEDQLIECWVYSGLSEAQEADKFLALNNRLNVNTFQKFKVALKAGHEVPLSIACIVNALKLVISKEQVPGAVRCVGTLLKVYTRYGAEPLKRALLIARDAYGDPGMEAKVIEGFGMLCSRYNGVLDEKETVGALSDVHGGVKGLLGMAEQMRQKTGNQKSACVAAAAVNIINHSRKGKKLAGWWKE